MEGVKLSEWWSEELGKSSLFLVYSFFVAVQYPIKWMYHGLSISWYINNIPTNLFLKSMNTNTYNNMDEKNNMDESQKIMLNLKSQT